MKKKENKRVTSPVGYPDNVRCARWEQRDLNPRQRVSTTEGATLREIMSHRSSYSSTVSKLLKSRSITGARQSARLAYTPLVDRYGLHFLRNFAALFLLLIFFLRHFQRWLPRFFQARELLFMIFPLD